MTPAIGSEAGLFAKPAGEIVGIAEAEGGGGNGFGFLEEALGMGEQFAVAKLAESETGAAFVR